MRLIRDKYIQYIILLKNNNNCITLRFHSRLKISYKRPFDPQNLVVCMDESPKQLIAETRIPVPCSPGKAAMYDYEYKGTVKSTGSINFLGSSEAGKIPKTSQT